MKNYVIVMEDKKGLAIGRKRYNKSEADKRLKFLKSVGISNMKIMHIQKAFGNMEE